MLAFLADRATPELDIEGPDVWAGINPEDIIPVL
jgi:hypothetical protein